MRFDHYSAYSSGGQLSPRVNAVWEFRHRHDAARRLLALFHAAPVRAGRRGDLHTIRGHHRGAAGLGHARTRPRSPSAPITTTWACSRSCSTRTLTLGVDSFYEQAQHLIDEGQFGAPIILTPFNYRYGLIGGVEFSANYSDRQLFRLLELALGRPRTARTSSRRSSISRQRQLNYIASNYIHLDHEGRVSASGGVSYLWLGTRFSADAIFGTGLREDLTLPDGNVIPNGDHTPSYTQINLGVTHAFDIAGSGPLTLRFDMINVADKVYQIRSGTGVGVFAPQYGPRRGFFGGLSWRF